jgi:hypothetical protein
MPSSYKRGRDARTGQFIPVKEAERRKTTAVVETVKVGQSNTGKQTGPTYRTIKSAPKRGNISRTSIERAVKVVSSSIKKK